jgi:hypothetical protein
VSREGQEGEIPRRWNLMCIVIDLGKFKDLKVSM